MSRKLIGITGKAWVGKDTVADRLRLVHRCEIYSFAEPIRRGLMAMFGFSPLNWQDREWKEAPVPWLGVSPRSLMQTLGTEWGRELVRDDLWLLMAQRHWLSCKTHLVIPDVRFNNEAKWIRDMGGSVLCIQRDVPSVLEHKSEAGIDFELVNEFLVNDRSLTDLYRLVDEYFSRTPGLSDDWLAAAGKVAG